MNFRSRRGGGWDKEGGPGYPLKKQQNKKKPKKPPRGGENVLESGGKTNVYLPPLDWKMAGEKYGGEMEKHN